MPVKVHVTRMLVKHLGMPPDFSVEARSLGELLDAMEPEHPGFRDSVCDETGRIRAYVNVFVNGDVVRQDPEVLSHALKNGDEVYIIENVAGGTGRACSSS